MVKPFSFYTVRIKVSNVRVVYFDEEEVVIHEIGNAGSVATAVGQNGLPGIFRLLAKGLLK